MSRKTTGTPGTTRRRVAVGTALLSLTALLGSGLASATAATPTVDTFQVYGTDGVTSGPLTGLTSVLEVKGSHLSDVDSVWFGDQRAAKVLQESDSLLYVTPPAHAAGTVHVHFSTDQSNPSDASGDKTYVYSAAPVVDTVTYADKNLTIKGSQFSGATAVLVGDALVKIDTKKNPVKDDTVVVKAPTVKTGLVAVSVVTPNGVGTKAGAWGAAPKLTKIALGSDATGKTAVTRASAATGTVTTGKADTATVSTYASATGTVVVITGSGFSGLKSLRFGDPKASDDAAVADVVVVNDGALRARVPAAAAKTLAALSGGVAKVSVWAENSWGTSNALKFQYDAAPEVTGASDLVGLVKAASNTVTISGVNLKDVKVYFGKTSAKIATPGDTSVTVSVPASKSETSVSIKVQNNAGFFTLPTQYAYKATDAVSPWPAS